MRHLFPAFVSFFLVAAVATAESIVTVSSAPGGRYLTDSSGVRLADGSLVWLGSFEDYDAISAMSVEDLQAAADWNLFGTTGVTSLFGNSGKISAAVTNNTPGVDSFFGKQIFIWVFNAPTLQASTQYGIFTAFGSDVGWLFPLGSADGDVTISLNDTLLTALLGSVNGNEMRLVAIPVPEPSAYALGIGLVSLAVIAVRRRSRGARPVAG